MKRRSFFKNSLVEGVDTLAGVNLPLGREALGKANTPFIMKFSPDFGMFAMVAEKASEYQIRWGHDNGFYAWECTFLKGRSLEEQNKISNTLQELGTEFGQFVGTMDFKQVTFAGRDESIRDNVLKEVRDSVEVAKRMNAKFIQNVLGMADPRLPWDFQLANATELLKRIAEIYEPHGLVMVMETMNHK